MHQKGRHEPGHDIGRILLVKELDNDHHIGSHEHFFVLLPKKFLQKLKSFFLIDDPVSSHTLNIDGKCKALWIVGLLSHLLLEVHIIYIAALTGRTNENVLIFSLLSGSD